MEIELVRDVHALDLEGWQPFRLAPEVMNPRLGGLNKDVAALDDPIREIDVLLERVARQVLVETLVLEDLPPVGHEPAVEVLELSHPRRQRHSLDEEAGPHL